MTMWAITQWIGRFLLGFLIFYSSMYSPKLRYSGSFVALGRPLMSSNIWLFITEKQHQKWCVCAAWIYSQLGLYAWHLHVMHFQWQSTIAVYANSLMMKGTFYFLHHTWKFVIEIATVFLILGGKWAFPTKVHFALKVWEFHNNWKFPPWGQSGLSWTLEILDENWYKESKEWNYFIEN
jgi:hypothetical protein